MDEDQIVADLRAKGRDDVVAELANYGGRLEESDLPPEQKAQNRRALWAVAEGAARSYPDPTMDMKLTALDLVSTSDPELAASADRLRTNAHRVGQPRRLPSRIRPRAVTRVIEFGSCATDDDRAWRTTG